MRKYTLMLALVGLATTQCITPNAALGDEYFKSSLAETRRALEKSETVSTGDTIDANDALSRLENANVPVRSIQFAAGNVAGGVTVPDGKRPANALKDFLKKQSLSDAALLSVNVNKSDTQKAKTSIEEARTRNVPDSGRKIAPHEALPRVSKDNKEYSVTSQPDAKKSASGSTVRSLASLPAPWGPYTTSIEATNGGPMDGANGKHYDRTSQLTGNWYWDKEHGSDISRIPDDYGIEFEFAERDSNRGEGTRPNCSQDNDDGFWARPAIDTFVLGWTIETGTGTSLDWANAEPYVDSQTYTDKCSELNFAIGVGDPGFLPRNSDGNVSVRTSIIASHGTEESSWGAASSSATSNNCNELGQKAADWCMGLADVKWGKPFPGPGIKSSTALSFDHKFYFPGCYTSTQAQEAKQGNWCLPSSTGPEVTNGSVLAGKWRADYTSGGRARIGFWGDSVVEGQGLPANQNALHDRVIEKLQSRLRLGSSCPIEPDIYRRSSTFIPAWYQSSPQISAAELTKSGPVNTTWLRDSSAGQGGRAAHLLLPGSASKPVPEYGTSLTFAGKFSGFDMDYYESAWGRVLEVKVDGKVVMQAPTYADLPAYKVRAKSMSWDGGGVASHTVVATVKKDQRFYGGTAVVGGFTPYDGDRDKCVKVLDQSHGGFGVHFVKEMAPDTVTHNIRSGTDIINGPSDNPRPLSLIAIEYGYNDAAYYSPGDFQVAMESLLLRIRDNGYNGPIALIGMPRPNVAPEWKSKNWNEYLDSERGIAKSMKDVAFIDLSRSIPAYPNGGVWADTVHLNASGTDLMASLLDQALRR